MEKNGNESPSLTLVVSDVHLGSRHCRAEAFLRFIETLPSAARLVLNGDILDFWRPLPPAHAQVLAMIKAEARQGREVIWIAGNNDGDYRLPDPGPIRFAPNLVLDEGVRIYIAHGDAFDRLMHGNILCTLPFRVMHALRQLAGRPSMHVAQYARKWPFVFDLLKGRLVRNALTYAEKNGYEAMVCGHTHFPEERQRGGIHYFNSGCWTEDDSYCVAIAGADIRLRRVRMS